MDAVTARANSRIGSVVRGKYRLDALLGVGGMAAVYVATHRNGHRVAVKIMHESLALDAEVRARFLREGYVANRVEHPGAVRVLDDDLTDDGSVFLVMELLEGETVEARAERLGGSLPLHEVVQVGLDVLDTLGAAHDKGIVHRDIKPDNLLITRQGTLKVLDFGIARLLETPGVTVTQLGRMIGTPAFMPPEQALGRTNEIDARTDVWSVGATLFTLASGQHVHDARTGEEMLIYTATRAPRSLAEVKPDAPPPIVAVIDKALSFNAADRWPSARAMQHALEQARAALHPGAPYASGSEPRLVGSDPALPLAVQSGAQSALSPRAESVWVPEASGTGPTIALPGGGTGPQQAIPVVQTGSGNVTVTNEPMAAPGPYGPSTTSGATYGASAMYPAGVPSSSRTAWVVAAVGFFLAVVVGGGIAALALHARGASAAAGPAPSAVTTATATTHEGDSQPLQPLASAPPVDTTTPPSHPPKPAVTAHPTAPATATAKPHPTATATATAKPHPTATATPKPTATHKPNPDLYAP